MIKKYRTGLTIWTLVAVAALALAVPAGADHRKPSSTELEVVGQLELAVGPGHITDVWALGDFAYLGSFDEPECSLDFTGVHIVDISSPENPTKVAFIPSPPDARANDVKAAHIETPFFQGDILVHSNEPCFGDFHPRAVADRNAAHPVPDPSNDFESTGGIAIYDVTDPTNPKQLRQNFLSFPVHNTYIYQQGSKAFMLVVDDINLRDLHIVDITKPNDPRQVAVVGAPDWPDLTDNIGVGEIFLHDVWAQENDGRVTAYLSYWDAGLVLLDITNPAQPVFLGDSEYQDPDPLSGEQPEGNSHVAVPTADGELVVMGDEDFSPFALQATITSGPFAGEAFRATQGSDVPPVTQEDPLDGPTVFVGRACDTSPAVPPAPSGDEIAVVERGDCTFTEKATNVSAAGYQGGIVFNSEDGNPPCEAIVNMSVEGDIAFLFVARSTGFKVLGITGYSADECPGGANPPLPAIGTQGESVDIRAVFDGWGYMRVLDVADPADMIELGQFATENVFTDPPPGGDRTMHNVIVRDRIAYLSWYAEGMRVVDFSQCESGGGENSCSPKEAAHFVAPEGSNFWGVYLHDHPDGNTYILGSDRDFGLYIFALPKGKGRR